MRKNNRNFSIIEICGISILSLAIIASVVIYSYKLSHLKFAEWPEDFGIFGDYVGGIIGTLVGLIGIIFLYRTYRIQLDISEKQEYKQEMQQFESAFFALLVQQRDILQNISGDFINSNGTKKPEIGAKFMSVLRIDLAIRLLELSYEPALLCKEKSHILKVRVNDIYNELFNNHIEQLSHYYRHLYHVIKFIDTHCPKNSQAYVDIVQAQMTTDELYLTAINGISNFGRKRFLPLLDKYHFFENLFIERGDIGDILISIFYINTKRKRIDTMKSNIIFVGGIHAVGKSTFAEYIKQRHPQIEALSCSELLKWEDPENKQVEDVAANQEKLISRLNELIDVDKPYLLDGHFCLINQQQEIETIESTVIQNINPALIILLREEVSIIHNRLLERDHRDYDIGLLEEMAEIERKTAHQIASQYDIPVYELYSGKYSPINPVIHELMRAFD